uniref:Uncharacterized protein n=1 Tax=Romanomermis culicivorax TaxID=13658 RepID=A0A915KNP5_ROMCU
MLDTFAKQPKTSAAYCHLQWWPIDRLYGLLDLGLFFILSSQCLINLVKAAHIGPGYVHIKWKPNLRKKVSKNSQFGLNLFFTKFSFFPDEISDQAKLQYCTICEGYKAPRSHHCRKCNRPRDDEFLYPYDLGWKENFKQVFIHNSSDGFKWPIVDGCDQFTFTVWYLYYGAGDEPIVELDLLGLFTAIFSFGLAVGVVLAVGFLLVVQMRSVFRNRSGIEDYIINKVHLFCDILYKIYCNFKNSNDVIKKGWFPRRCVVELEETDCVSDNDLEKKMK